MASKNKSKSVIPRRSLPTRGAKTVAIAGVNKVIKVENTPATEDEALAAEIERVKTEEEALALRLPDKIVSEYIPQGPDNPKSILTTFKTTTKLEGGLCIVREAGVGKFEIINLSTVAGGALGSEAVGNMLASNSALANMVDIKQQDWDNARVKCQQAIMSARGEIFRFFKFPLELRNMIYETCLVSPLKLATTGTATKAINPPNLALLRTSRTVYEEAAPFFQKNTFIVDYFLPARLKVMIEGLNENIRILEVHVNGNYVKDQEMFLFLQSCKSLKKLTVIYSTGAQYRRRSRPQRLYQDDLTLAKFSRLNGFDILCSLRGLEKVKIVVTEPSLNAHYGIKETERLRFEDFLMTKVTQAPMTEEEIAAKKKAALEAERKLAKAKKVKASHAKPRSGKKRVTLDPDDSQDEYDGTPRSWAH